MRIKRAVFIGALLWGLLLLEARTLNKFLFKLRTPNMTYYIVYYAIIIILIFLASLIYFRKRETGAFEGLYLGFIFIFVGVVLDSVLTIPLFMYMNYLFLISKKRILFYAINLVVCTIIGFLKKQF
jgi:hypothetical protein